MFSEGKKPKKIKTNNPENMVNACNPRYSEAAKEEDTSRQTWAYLGHLVRFYPFQNEKVLKLKRKVGAVGVAQVTVLPNMCQNTTQTS